MSFDSHCHLTAEAFDGDREAVILRAREAGVRGMVCIASTPADARACVRLAESHADIWCTAGLHPHEAGGPPEDWATSVRELLDHPRVVAVGECGLDFHYDFAPREAQFQVLEAQIAMAAETGLPLVVHSRSADAEMTDALRRLPAGVRGVLHCFTGGDELLAAGLDAGWYVSFSGLVTFSRFDAQAQVRAVPRHRILVETDAPYLAPVPFRGKRNEPARVTLTTARVAEILGEDPEIFALQVEENARTFYGLPRSGETS